MSDASGYNSYPSAEEQQPYEQGFPLPEAPRTTIMPPGDGGLILPHFETFGQIVNYASRTYRYTHDEAIRASWTNMLAMRRDPVLMDALRSRQIPTAQLPWHLEAEDDKDTRQAAAVEDLTHIIEQTPRFQQLKMHLLEALWFGRYGTQMAYSWRFRDGKRFLAPRDFKPINGDKLVFRFSGEPGILVHMLYPGEWAQTDRGRAHFFTPQEREQLVIHKYEPEDADFLEPQLAGGVEGVGIRGRLYWFWYLRSQVLSFLMDYLERVGAGGFTLYYFEAGSQSSLNEVQQAVQNQWRNNAILFPRYRDGSTGGPGIERIEPSTAGANLLQTLVTSYFDNVMRRFILGQNLTTEAASTGLGSGLADLHGETFARYIKYDAVALADTLTSDFVSILQKYSPYHDLPPLRFVFDVDKPNAVETLTAAKSFYDMGGSVDADQLRSVIGLEKPTEGATILAQMGAMSPASAGAIPQGVPMEGQPGPMAQAGGMMPGGSPQESPSQGGGPVMMQRARAGKLRFSKDDFHEAVSTAFPDAKIAEGRFTVPYQDREIILRYHPSANMARIDFNWQQKPGRQSAKPLGKQRVEDAAKGLITDESRLKPNQRLDWTPAPRVQKNSIPFTRQMKWFLHELGSRGVGLYYTADEHHDNAYTRLLKKWGWILEEERLGSSGLFHKQWRPPRHTSPGPVPMQRKRGYKLRLSAEDWNAVVKKHYPEAEAPDNEFEPRLNLDGVHHIPLGDRELHLSYDHRRKLAHVAFRWSDFGPAGGPFKAGPSLRNGSLLFWRRLNGFLRELGASRIGVTYSADSHHHKAYTQALKRAGYKMVYNNAARASGPLVDYEWRPKQFSRKPRPTPFSREGEASTLTADPGLLSVVNDYANTHGHSPHTASVPYAPLAPGHSRRVADHYDTMPHNPSDPAVKAAYQALKQETLAQWNHLRAHGYIAEPWEGEGQPYADSTEMTADARKKHLFFFTGGDIPSDHPLAELSPVKHRDQRLTYNDIFRAVHDYFGHSLYGNQFGPRGEEHAYRTHARMYSPLAVPALAAETRGQNSWVNFGKHLRREDGSLPLKGDADFVPPPKRPYAEQKANVLPANLLK